MCCAGLVTQWRHDALLWGSFESSYDFSNLHVYPFTGHSLYCKYCSLSMAWILCAPSALFCICVLPCMLDSVICMYVYTYVYNIILYCMYVLCMFVYITYVCTFHVYSVCVCVLVYVQYVLYVCVWCVHTCVCVCLHTYTHSSYIIAYLIPPCLPLLLHFMHLRHVPVTMLAVFVSSQWLTFCRSCPFRYQLCNVWPHCLSIWRLQ